jgi:membrane protease YdiL (CAAX protease family)
VDSIQKQTNKEFAAQLRGFGPIGILAIVVILVPGNIMLKPMWTLPIGAVWVIVWAYLSKTPWNEIGYAKPKSWLITVPGGIFFGISFKLVMKAIVMPLLGAADVNQAYHFLVGNNSVLPSAIWAMFMAGFSEETLFRGWMFERLDKLIGRGTGAKIFIIAFTSLWFGFDHYAIQGIGGVEQSTIMGIIFGIIRMKKKKIWLLMIAHAAFDLTALAIIYWNLEKQVAHLIFK